MTADHELLSKQLAHLVFKSHHLLPGVEDQCKARVIPAGEHLTTPLITFLLNPDAKRLNTFCRHMHGWRLLHLWCFWGFFSVLLLNDSHFHTFAKQWSEHSQWYSCSWWNLPWQENVCMEAWEAASFCKWMRRDNWPSKWGTSNSPQNTRAVCVSGAAFVGWVMYNSASAFCNSVIRVDALMSFALFSYFAKVNQDFYIYCDLTPPLSEKRLIYS